MIWGAPSGWRMSFSDVQMKQRVSQTLSIQSMIQTELVLCQQVRMELKYNCAVSDIRKSAVWQVTISATIHYCEELPSDQSPFPASQSCDTESTSAAHLSPSALQQRPLLSLSLPVYWSVAQNGNWGPESVNRQPTLLVELRVWGWGGRAAGVIQSHLHIRIHPGPGCSEDWGSRRSVSLSDPALWRCAALKGSEGFHTWTDEKWQDWEMCRIMKTENNDNYFTFAFFAWVKS